MIVPRGVIVSALNIFILVANLLLGIEGVTMKYLALAVVLLATSGVGIAQTSTSQGCVGSVSRLWVEANDDLYFNIQPTSNCNCNFNADTEKGFIAPADQANKDEQYAALLSAFVADIPVMSWFDWRSSDGSLRCRSWSITLAK